MRRSDAQRIVELPRQRLHLVDRQRRIELRPRCAAAPARSRRARRWSARRTPRPRESSPEETKRTPAAARPARGPACNASSTTPTIRTPSASFWSPMPNRRPTALPVPKKRLAKLRLTTATVGSLAGSLGANRSRSSKLSPFDERHTHRPPVARRHDVVGHLHVFAVPGDIPLDAHVPARRPALKQRHPGVGGSAHARRGSNLASADRCRSLPTCGTV